MNRFLLEVCLAWFWTCVKSFSWLYEARLGELPSRVQTFGKLGLFSPLCWMIKFCACFFAYSLNFASDLRLFLTMFLPGYRLSKVSVFFSTALSMRFESNFSYRLGLSVVSLRFTRLLALIYYSIDDDLNFVRLFKFSVSASTNWWTCAKTSCLKPKKSARSRKHTEYFGACCYPFYLYRSSSARSLTRCDLK